MGTSEKKSNNVIQFPQKQSLKKRMQDKVQDQKAVLSLSIASVLVMSLFLNQWLIGGRDENGGATREIASFNGAAQNVKQDIQWEHELAKKLSEKDLEDPSKLADKPTLRDDLIFGYLQGKYGMKVADNKIQSLEFIDAQNGEQPMVIDKKVEFLMSYQEAMGFKFDQVSLNHKEQGEEVYTLLDHKNIVASASFKLDDQGRVTSVHINP